MYLFFVLRIFCKCLLVRLTTAVVAYPLRSFQKLTEVTCFKCQFVYVIKVLYKKNFFLLQTTLTEKNLFKIQHNTSAVLFEKTKKKKKTQNK